MAREFNYIVIDAATATALRLLVVARLEIGWQLQGGVFVTGTRFYQAMLKTG